MKIYVYQYISGVSLQKHIIEYNQCDNSLLEQVARAAAIIHNTSEEKTKNLKEINVPPFEMWYQYFLENSMVREQLGTKLCERIQRLLSGKRELLSEIDMSHLFIVILDLQISLLMRINKYLLLIGNLPVRDIL